MYLNQQGFKIFSPSTWRASSRHPPASHFKVLFTAGNWLFNPNYWTVINSQFVHCYCFLMFNHTLWILGKEKKLLATPLSLLIPKVIPVSGTVIWETDLVLSHYSNSCRWILLALWSSGRYRASRETVRLSSLLSLFGKGMRPSLLFCPFSLSIGIIPMGSTKWGYAAISAFPSLPPCGTQEAGFPLCHFSFENSLHCLKSPLYTALGVPCHGGQREHGKPNESRHSGREVLGNLMFWRGREWTASERSAKMSSETLRCSVRITF